MSQSPLVVILAGGQGRNFAPLVTNKTLFPFMGQPLLGHQLIQLRRVGFANILVASNADNEAYLQSLDIPNLNIQTKLQPQPLGMADAVLNLAEKIGEQPIIIINAVDVVNDNLFEDLLHEIQNDPQKNMVTGIEVTSHFPGGYLQLQGENQVSSIIEKPQPGKEPSNLVSLVFHYFSQPKKFFRLLKRETDAAKQTSLSGSGSGSGSGNNNGSKILTDDIYEQALTELMQTEKFSFIRYQGYWQKLKYPHYVLDMMKLFLEKRLKPQIDPTAQLHPQAVIEGPVFIDAKAKIEAGAVIKGPAYIGKGAIVGNHTLVRDSMVESKAIIGFGSEVARSYIGPECALHANFIGDSVLEAEVNPSFGTATANWRLDKKNVMLRVDDKKIETQRDKLGAILAKGVFSGVNCSFMPGVTVGAHTKIYPQTIVRKALPAHTTLKPK